MIEPAGWGLSSLRASSSFAEKIFSREGSTALIRSKIDHQEINEEKRCDSRGNNLFLLGLSAECPKRFLHLLDFLFQRFNFGLKPSESFSFT